jgi:hypothetical protein
MEKSIVADETPMRHLFGMGCPFYVLELGGRLRVCAQTTWIQIGPAAFKTKTEADKQVSVVCKKKM